MRQKQQVFAVLRLDDFHTADVPIENKITVTQIVSSQEIAEREVERLTRLHADKGLPILVAGDAIR